MSHNALAPDWLQFPDDINAFDTALWPENIVRNDDGVTEIGGRTVTDLATEYGTPLYVFDAAMLKERAARFSRTFTEAFAAHGVDTKIYYAGKAFLSSRVVRWMLDAGLNIDTSTEGELSLALIAGATGDRIGLHGNNKSDREIELAVASEVAAIVIDTQEEIGKIAAEAAKKDRIQGVRLRVRTGVHASTHDFLATAHEDQKFGVALSEVVALVQEIRQHASLKFLGIHSHIGSQIFGSDGFKASIRASLALHKELTATAEVPEINFGGGFGIAYTEQDEPDQIESIAEELATAFAEAAKELDLATLPTVAFEPGRWIVGPAGITLYSAGVKKDVELADPEHSDSTLIRRYQSVDGGMSDNARTALYGADYRSRLLSRTSSAETILTRVVGKHCESGDIVVQDDYLPADISAGDIIGVAATGAYCHSLASNYNLVPRPAVVAVQDGEAELLVYRETVAELLGRDAGPIEDF